MTRIDEIVDGIYRISTMPKDSPISFNQFLIDDEHPALIHTGMAPLYQDIRNAIGKILDPARISYAWGASLLSRGGTDAPKAGRRSWNVFPWHGW